MSFDKKEIIKKAKNGDKKASRAIYDEYSERIFRYLSSKIRTDFESRRLNLDPCDLSQTIWLKAFLGLRKGQGQSEEGDGFVRWLYRIARNEFLNARKKAIRYSELVEVETCADSETGDEDYLNSYRSETQTDVSDHMERQERIDILYEAIRTLKDPYKSVIVLELSEVPRSEIGEKLELSETYVRVIVSRAKVMLKKAFIGRLD